MDLNHVLPDEADHAFQYLKTRLYSIDILSYSEYTVGHCILIYEVSYAIPSYHKFFYFLQILSRT